MRRIDAIIEDGVEKKRERFLRCLDVLIIIKYMFSTLSLLFVIKPYISLRQSPSSIRERYAFVADTNVYTWVSSAYKWDPTECWYDIQHQAERRSRRSEHSNMSIAADTSKIVSALTFPVSMFSDMSLDMKYRLEIYLYASLKSEDKAPVFGDTYTI